MLVLPLSLSIHDLVMDILAVHNKIFLDVEDEVPRITEGMGHLAKLVKISTFGGFALFKLVGDIGDNVTQFLSAFQDGVEVSVLELVNDTSEAFPNVFCVT